MPGDELRDKGIAAAKAGRKDEARALLTQATQANPRDTQAWLFLASVTDDKKARLLALRRVLELDPHNGLGLAAVKALGVDPAKLMATLPPAEQPPAPPTPPTPPTPPAVPPTQGGIRSLAGTPPKPPVSDALDLNFFDDDEPPQPTPGGIKPLAADESTPSGGIKPLGDDLDQLLRGEFAQMGPAKSGAPTQEDLDMLFGGEPTPAAPSGPKKLPSLSERPRATDEVAAVPGRARTSVDPNQPGVPVPDPDFVAQAVKDVEYLAEALLGREPAIAAEWTKKSKGRAGEADVWRLRAQIWGTIGGFVLALGILAAIVLSTPEGQRAIGRITRTPSRTPTNTPTVTPGFTPTPTATLDSTRFPTYTPSATIALTLSPVGNPNMTPRPTQRYLPVPLDGGLPNAVTLLDRGLIDQALPTLDAERLIVSAGNYNPNAYYWDGIALARVGKFNEAFNILSEGENRLEQDTNSTERPQFKALIDLGFAEYEYLRGLDFQSRGEAGNARGAFEAARERAESTLSFDPRYAQAYLIIARTWRAERNPDEALLALEQPYLLLDRIPEFGTNVDFVVERGDIYMLRASMRDANGNRNGAIADLEAAMYEGYYAVYLNPYDRRGHELRIAAALELGRAGDAVLANDTYRLYYPDDTRALRLLGDARIAEGNPDLAFGAYAAALNADLVDADGVPGPDSADILADRAALYLSEGEYAAALADLNTALSILPDRLDLQAQRMDAAFAAGEFDIALADAQALFNSRVAPNDVFKLMEARVLVTTSMTASPEERRVALQQADDALDYVGVNLPSDLRPIAGEVRASVLLELGFPADAVIAADGVLALTNAPKVRQIRAQAWEAQFRLDNAARDYRRVLDDTIDVDEDLALAAAAGLERVNIGSTATSTAVTATAIVQATSTGRARQTATRGAQMTATANIHATATAVMNATETADAAAETATAIATASGTAPRPEASLTPSRTPDASADDDETVTPTRTPSPTRTPTPTRTP